MATGTRELEVLSPRHLASRIDAVLLTGGSAFGLAAAEGVVAWLAGRGVGFDTGVAPVPLVPAAVIFDLDPGVSRPTPDEGSRAAERASADSVREGRVGAGAGATVGKILGADRSSPGGVGSASGPFRDGWVGVLAVVNALGDVLAPDGSVMAGPRGAEGGFHRTDDLILGEKGAASAFPGTNTTLVVVGTDLPLGKEDLSRLARMVAAALPRVISPVETPFDGDLVFTLSSSAEVRHQSPHEILALGVLAGKLTEEAVRRAVMSVDEDPPAERNEGDES
jgi:L-aminopeptidase/D-esterase-like protein